MNYCFFKFVLNRYNIFPQETINYKVRIQRSVDHSIEDYSNQPSALIAQPKIEAYPNPGTTQGTLKFNEKDNENYTLTLYNRYNMRIMTRKVNASYLKEVRINTFDLPSGIYFLRLTSAKNVISKKIIVQH